MTASASYSALPARLPGLLTLLLVLVISLAPLALGSNRPLPWGYNAMLAGTFLIVAVIWQFIEMRHGSSVQFRPVAVPLFLFLLVMIWVGLQIVPLPQGILPNPIWQLAADLDGSISSRSISINPMNSIDAAMRFLTYASVFLAAYLLACNPDRALIFLWGFVGSTCLYAVYGLARFGLHWNKILWFETLNTTLSGPFISQNNAATFFGLGLVCALALLLQVIRRTERKSRHSSGRYRVVAAFQAISGKSGLAMVLFTVLLVTLLMTASRGGILATLGGCLTLMVLRFLKQRRGGHGATQFAGLAAVVILFAVIIEFSGARFAARIMTSDLDTGGRFEVYRMTSASIFDNALLGTGLGTFQDIFPIYRDDPLEYGLTWDKAHNDYLELFVGLGVPAALVFLLALALLFLTVLRGYFRRRRDSIYSAVAVSATILVALHSLIDFSLQIQAIGMAFAMLLGVGTAQSGSSRSTASG